MMLLPSRCVVAIEFSDALLYKLLAQMACILAVASSGSLATPYIYIYADIKV
jgi:hypothetical protein